MSATPSQSNLEAAIAKFHAFCTARAPLKSDEELADTFESFSVGNADCLDKGEQENVFYDFKKIEEGLLILNELKKNVIIDGDLAKR